MNPIRVLISAVPTFLAFLSRKRIQDEKNPVVNLCVNMSVITIGVSLIAVVTSGIMVGRMPIYTSLWNLILLPHVIRITFQGRTRSIIYWLAIIMYFMLYLYSVGAI